MRKDDTDKLDYSLLADMPNALEAVVGVMHWAITEKSPDPYSRSSWLCIPNASRRLRAAEERHQAALDKERDDYKYTKYDDESHILHLAHRAASVLMRLEIEIREGNRWRTQP